MDAERWQQIKSILHSALERDPRERAAFLDHACAASPSLRSEVESLILSHDHAGAFIEAPAIEVMANSLDEKAHSLTKQSFGPYQIEARIGTGGMGEVYLAHDSRLGRKVALKMLPDYFTRDDERVRRFQQEARAASALNHPNILTIYEIGQVDSRHFIATEFIEGDTLRDRMSRSQMTIVEVLDVAAQVAWALSAAHQAGIAHRDIKPGNIMLRPDGVVKVLDFGLAKLTEKQADDLEAATLLNTKQGMVMGTAHYMSPEQARGLKVDVRSDIFSLGVVLYEMVTGRVPFAGPTMTDVLASILMLEPPSLSQAAPEAPDELQRIVHRALRKDKEERYKTSAELLTDLKALKKRIEFETELERSNESREWSSAEHQRQQIKLRGIESLAVLPLIDASAGASMEYFSDGVTESLINSLAQLPSLRVVARSTVFRYKGTELDPHEVGKQLGVRAVLTGRVRQAGDDLMIAAELIDIKTDAQLWGEHYNRKLSDVFAVQEEIASEITEKLRLKLTGADRRRLAKHFTEDPKAYHAYLKGRYYWNKRSTPELQKAIEHFRQAIDLDPGYAAAYAGLSDSYTLLVVREAMSPQEGFAKAKGAAAKALEIDPDLSEARASLGHALLHNWEWEAAEKELKRAIALNPGYPSAHHWYSEHLTAMGRFDESVKELGLAGELDPLSLVINTDLGRAFYFARQYDQTIEQEKKTLEMDANFWLSHINLGRSYTQKKMHADAIRELQTASDLSPGNTESLSYLAFAYTAAGDRDKALLMLGDLEQQAAQGYVPPYHLAIIHTGLGQKDEAFAWLERAYEARAVDFFTLNVEPMFDQLRSDARFTDIIQRIGLDPAPVWPRTLDPAVQSQSSLETVSSMPTRPRFAESGAIESPQQNEFAAEPAAVTRATESIRSSVPLEQEIRFCTTGDGVRIAYATVGDGPPLVKAANWLNHLEFDLQSPIWRHVVQEFARDHLLVRYDERGNGLSDWNVENFGFETFVQDLETVVDALGLERFPILGISQGGPVAIAYAIRHPEKVSHLILYGSYARGWAKRGVPEDIERRQTQNKLINLGWGQDNPAFRQLWTTQYVPDGTPEQWNWFNDLHRICISPDNAAKLELALGQIDVVDLLSQVKVPTLVLHCRDEVCVPFEEGRLLAAKIPGARFVPLEGRNHLLLENEPTWPKFVAEVRRFLETEPSEVKPERASSPDSFNGGASDRQIKTGKARESEIHTKQTPPAPIAARTGEIAPAAVTTSTELAAGEIKRNKTVLAGIAAIVVLVIAALFYSYFAGRGRTIDSLAVLPFINASGDVNNDYLSDGIAESIIYSTSRLRDLKVMPRSSVFSYKNKGMDPQAIGRELGVSAILTGIVNQRGDELSISAELIDLRDNRVLWGQQYVRKMADIIAVQEEISREISEKLRLRLTSDEQKRLSKRDTENTEAYQLYLKGRYYWNKRSAEGYQKGIEHFQQAIDKDPNYALAWTGLADSYMLFGRFGVVPPKESLPKAKAAAAKALELDDELAEAHTSMGYIKKEYDWDFQGAEAELKRAIELNPNYPIAHFWYALYLAETLGKSDEALAKMDRAQELEPLSLIMITDRGMILYLARRYDEAVEQFHKTLDMDPNFFRAHFWQGRAFEQQGKYKEAVQEFEKARKLDDKPFVLAALGHAYAASGRRAEAQKVLAELSAISKRMYVDSYYVAAIHVALGDKEQAFQALEKAYEDRSTWLSRIKFDPLFDNIRSDQKFTSLTQRIGLP